MELQMVYSVHKEMERSSCSSAKIERKIIEKNRRNHMKNLYCRLNSLLPRHTSKEPLSLPDQIDEAVNYIKSLQTRLKESREKKESLTGRKRSHRCANTTAAEAAAVSRSPEISINETDSAIEVVLMTGQDCQFMFYEMIRILHEEGAQVLNANFSVLGNTIVHIVHAEIGAHMFTFGAEKIKEKLNKFVHNSSSEQQLQQELWDFEIHPETWDFPIM
ncbi:transcription factor bHLH162-like [Herrania umbratica]|uniref:Transcription factor bHLH162-like n=1 Tax=Herrania umbratica TaxID=108875 RepID=A0A6J1AP14_9ROSI|nr:transcription factor bHLH162-like [Herrania umbratica]